MDALRDSWLRRPIFVGVLLVALVGLVVLAAHGHVASSGGNGSALTSGIVDTLVSALLAVYALGAIVLFAALVWSRGEWTRRQSAGSRKRRTLSGIAIFIAILALLVASGDRLRNRFSAAHPVKAATPGAAGAAAKGAKARQRHHARFRVAPFLAVFAGLGVAGFVVYNSTRGSRRPPRDPLSPALAEELEDTLRALRAETDPRRAVSAAYARMERLLGESGLPRYPHEAPLEYMSRVLLGLGGGVRPVRSLTHLFERARFSPHTVDSVMKDEAVDALETLQADLAAAESEVAA